MKPGMSGLGLVLAHLVEERKRAPFHAALLQRAADLVRQLREEADAEARMGYDLLSGAADAKRDAADRLERILGGGA